MTDTPSISDLRRLRAGLAAATGHDATLDGTLARLLDDGGESDYSASVSGATALIARCLPDWRWHVGYGASGVFPYASLSRGDVVRTASAPTVPLALLLVLVDAMLPGSDDDPIAGPV